MKQFVLLSVVAFLALVAFSSIASAEMIDVVHLKNGSIIQGTIIENIPNESLKIKTADGDVSVVEMSEVEKVTPKVTKPKSPATAVGLGCGTGCLSLYLSPLTQIQIPIVGIGQVYNGQYKKGLAFFGVGLFGFYLSGVGRDDEEWTFRDRIGELGVTLIIGSAVDAYYSAKRINLEAEKKASSTSLDYTPHQGIMASYNVGF